MGKLRVHNLSISIDGYGAGPNQSLENPLGVGGPRLHEWVFKTRTGRRMLGEQGGDEGLDDQFLERGDAGIGATIMGRNMFGPIRGEWSDETWKGWWGPNPPYHHPVFVLTTHASRFRWRAEQHSISSPTASNRRCRKHSLRPATRTCG